LETVTLVFMSDGAPGFSAAVAALQRLQAPTVAEDGTFQDLSTPLHSPGITIKVRSELGSNEAPDAASTAGLLGIALAGIAWFARNRRAAAN
jgi:hypothetical protein